MSFLAAMNLSLALITLFVRDSWFMIARVEANYRETILNRRQQLSVESVFADLPTMIQLRFFHRITMRYVEERHQDCVRRNKPAAKLMCAFCSQNCPISILFIPSRFLPLVSFTVFPSARVEHQSESNLAAAKTHLSAILLINERFAGGGIRGF